MPRKRTLEERQAQIALGKRIRARRKELSICQNSLAMTAGVRFQQIQNYETGKDMVPPDRLELIAEALQTTPSQLLGEVQELSPPDSSELTTLPAELTAFLMNPGMLRFMRAMSQIPRGPRNRIINLVSELASAGD